MQVYPEGILETSVERGLRDHPRLLVIWHPFYETWQVYERPRHGGSDWDARRLYNAVVQDHERDQAFTGSGEYVPGMKDVSAPWWHERGAPYCLDDDLGLRPGPWFLTWAEHREHSRVNIRPTDWWLLMEHLSEAREQSNREQMHDRHKDMAYDTRRQVLDQMPHGVSVTDALKAIRKAEGRPEIVG